MMDMESEPDRPERDMSSSVVKEDETEEGGVIALKFSLKSAMVVDSWSSKNQMGWTGGKRAADWSMARSMELYRCARHHVARPARAIHGLYWRLWLIDGLGRAVSFGAERDVAMLNLEAVSTSLESSLILISMINDTTWESHGETMEMGKLGQK